MVVSQRFNFSISITFKEKKKKCEETDVGEKYSARMERSDIMTLGFLKASVFGFIPDVGMA